MCHSRAFDTHCSGVVQLDTTHKQGNKQHPNAKDVADPPPLQIKLRCASETLQTRMRVQPPHLGLAAPWPAPASTRGQVAAGASCQCALSKCGEATLACEPAGTRPWLSCRFLLLSRPKAATAAAARSGEASELVVGLPLPKRRREGRRQASHSGLRSLLTLWPASQTARLRRQRFALRCCSSASGP